MRGLLVCAVASLVLGIALADTTAPRPIPTNRIDSKDIPLDELAHNFFVLQSAPQILAQVISPQGLARLEPELAAQNRDMSDRAKSAAKMRQICSGLQNAQTGAEFAAVLSANDEQEHDEMRSSARRIMSVLDADDREALENYLNERVRRNTVKSTVDWQALFASPADSFPNAYTEAATRQACDSAAMAEKSATESQP